MTDAPATPHPARRYRLGTFGTLALVGAEDDTVLGTHGHHRRRLALLAVLAAAAERGRSRDQLLGLFWPNATQARARHSLDQLLYALRSSIGESVFASANPVRLNPDVVTSDIGVFTAALERGDLEAAVEVYSGPFLDGFYIEDAPEFERWVETERAGLAGSYSGALERLARSAEAAQDHATAVRWWRKLAEADPVSSQNAMGLIRALMNVGDHAAALQYAERYEAVVAQELGTSVGPAVASLVAEVRGKTKAEPVALSKSPPSLPPRPKPPATPVSVEAAPNDQPRPEPSRGRRRAPYVIGALVAVFIAMAAVVRATMHDRRAPPAAEPSIAVLPLLNVSRNPQDVALVDGLSEELIAVLAKLGGLRVTARTSAFVFKNSDAGVRRIADSLGVSYVLEGAVQRVDSQLRVQVRLVDARDGSTRWSETYDRALRDIFVVQSEIAASVARELDLRLGAGAATKLRRRPTQNIAAYELYLRGRDPIHMRAGSDSGPLEGLSLLQQAVALDSNFAAAYGNMPYMYVVLAARADLDKAREYRRLADSVARKAVALDPSLPEAHVAVAISHLIGRTDLRAAESALRRALELGGAPRAREHLANVLLWMGRPAEGLAEARRAAVEDPLSASAAADVGNALCVNGRYDEGLTQLTRVATVRPPLQRTAFYAGLCFAMKGSWPEAITQLRGSQDPRSPALLGYSLARSGAVDEARRIRAEFLERWRRTKRGAFNLAVVAAGLGDRDEAFEWLDRSVDDLSLAGHIAYPLFDELHADARFERYRRSSGLQKR